jgi:hypothetical protein
MAKLPAPYLVVHQTRSSEPTEYENLLAEGLERSYAAGLNEPETIVANLNELCVPGPNGKPWTPEIFMSELKRLGA